MHVSFPFGNMQTLLVLLLITCNVCTYNIIGPKLSVLDNALTMYTLLSLCYDN